MIKDFKIGDVISDNFLLRSCELATGKSGKQFGKLSLEDRSGTIAGVMWDGLHQLSQLESGDIVHVQLSVSTYNDALQAKVMSIAIADPTTVIMDNLIRTSKYDIDTMMYSIIELAKSIKDQWWSKLVCYFYSDSDFLKRLRCQPAAKSVHHAYSGGLLQHTLHVATLADKAASVYEDLDRDLIVSTALLHDIGKINELCSLPVHDYTCEGNLIGHIVEGQNLVRDACSHIEGFPEDRKNIICHCILSHHGELEYGSPKKPMLAEAMVVHLCDEMDAKVELYLDAFTDLNTSTLNSKFTGYQQFLGTTITSTSLFE